MTVIKYRVLIHYVLTVYTFLQLELHNPLYKIYIRIQCMQTDIPLCYTEYKGIKLVFEIHKHPLIDITTFCYLQNLISKNSWGIHVNCN